MVHRPTTERLLASSQYGFWVRTKLPPYRAVRWETQYHEDGRQSFRGRNWVEVLPHGENREPERYLAADVELAGPHEWLTYFPAVEGPVCGWGKPRLPHGHTQYCPQPRGEGHSYCPKHQAELSAGEDSNGQPGHQPAGGAAVPAPQRGSDPAGEPGDGE